MSEYIERKKKIDEILCAYVDEMFDINETLIWNLVLQCEAMLLFPNERPKSCSNGNCGSLICTFCYGISSNNRKCRFCIKTAYKN